MKLQVTDLNAVSALLFSLLDHHLEELHWDVSLGADILKQTDLLQKTHAKMHCETYDFGENVMQYQARCNSATSPTASTQQRNQKRK